MTSERDALSATVDGERSVPSEDERPPNSPNTWRVEWIGLLGAIAIFVALMTYFGELRAGDFYAYNCDLGINQHMLWTTIHGHVHYEAGDNDY